MEKRKMIIEINSLGNNWYCGLNYEGYNEGGGMPIKDEKELKESIANIKKRFSDKYVFVEIDKRIKQKTLF